MGKGLDLKNWASNDPFNQITLFYFDFIKNIVNFNLYNIN